MKWTILVLMSFLLGPGCIKKEKMCCGLPPVELIKEQTQCADPWGYGSTDNETSIRLTAWLKQKNIEVVKIEITADGHQEVCLACACKSGKVLHVWADQQYLNLIKAEGFVIK